jgi:ribose-phosphate pyrophosphokinase
MDNTVVIANTNCYSLPFPFIPVTITRFADGEIRPFIEGDIQGKNIIYIASMYPVPSDIILEWVLTIDAVKRKGAASITAVIPYMPYIRQSKVHREGESCSAEVVSRILSTSGVDRMLTFDLHNESAVSFFTVPVVHLSALSLLPPLMTCDAKTIVVSPDQGSAARAKLASDLLNVPLVVLQKKRSLVAGDIVEEITLQDDVTGTTVIMVDDIISTGSTIVKATRLLKDHGVKKVIVFAVHAVLAGNAKSILEQSGIDRFIVTDTIERGAIDVPKGTEIVSIKPLLEKALMVQ